MRRAAATPVSSGNGPSEWEMHRATATALPGRHNPSRFAVCATAITIPAVARVPGRHDPVRLAVHRYKLLKTPAELLGSMSQ